MNTELCKHLKKESRVDMELAKLAKEKGFNIPSFYIWENHGNNKHPRCEFICKLEDEEIVPLWEENLRSFEYYAPTFSELQGWLREKHVIDVLPYLVGGSTTSNIKQCLKGLNREYAVQVYKDGELLPWYPDLLPADCYYETFGDGLKLALEQIIL